MLIPDGGHVGPRMEDVMVKVPVVWGVGSSSSPHGRFSSSERCGMSRVTAGGRRQYTNKAGETR